MKQSFCHSVKHAIEGVIYTIKNERNMKIHLFIMTCVIICGFIFHISFIKWCICLFLFSLVLSLEILNTAIEATVDLCTSEFHPLAKVAKDAAAGAVLVSSLFAAIIGLMIFIPEALNLLKFFF